MGVSALPVGESVWAWTSLAPLNVNLWNTYYPPHPNTTDATIKASALLARYPHMKIPGLKSFQLKQTMLGLSCNTPTVQENIAYDFCEYFVCFSNTLDDKKQQLDIYIPSTKRFPNPGPFPVCVHVHGGGWVRGDRKARFYGAPAISESFAKKGVICVAVSYRLGKFPENIQDVAKCVEACVLLMTRSVRWVYDNIESYGGDANNISISGHSAGAHLVSLLVVDPTWLQVHELSPSIFKGM